MLGGLDYIIHARIARQIDRQWRLKEKQRNTNIRTCVSEHVDVEGDDDDGDDDDDNDDDEDDDDDDDDDGDGDLFGRSK